MFKRVRWIGMGAMLGAGGSIYAQLKMRRTAQRYLPPEVGARVADRARRLGQEVQEAVAEGRQAMAEREAELRAIVETRPDARQDVRDASSRLVGGADGRLALDHARPPGRRDRRPPRNSRRWQ